jgi:hypothetical protein
MREVAAEKGGKCLSEEYVNNKTPLLWECGEGHRWEVRPYNVVRVGTWCPSCWAERQRLGIEQMQEVAAEKGGKCLSEEYASNKTPLLWECGEGHRWEARPDSVVRVGTWCPVCARRRRAKAG